MNPEPVRRSPIRRTLSSWSIGAGPEAGAPHFRTGKVRRQQRAFASMDLFLAMAVFLFGFFSVAYLSTREMRLARAYYYDSIALSLVDGELEVLAAGEWRSLPEGPSRYRSQAATMHSLPPGELRVTRTPTQIQLEWIPAAKGNGRHITRAFSIAGEPDPQPERKP